MSWNPIGTPPQKSGIFLVRHSDGRFDLLQFDKGNSKQPWICPNPWHLTHWLDLTALGALNAMSERLPSGINKTYIVLDGFRLKFGVYKGNGKFKRRSLTCRLLGVSHWAEIPPL